MDEKEELLEQIRVLTEKIEALKNGESEDERAVNEFLKEYPIAEEFLDEITEKIENDGLCGSEGLKNAFTAVLAAKYRKPEQLASDGEFLEKFVFANKDIRKRIIDEYIDAVSKSPSACVKRNGLPFTKPEKPSTVHAAGELARALFRK